MYILKLALFACSVILCGCAMGPSDLGLNDREWAYFHVGQKAALWKAHWMNARQWCQKPVESIHNNPIRLTFKTGYATMWPGKIQQAFEPADIILSAGDCVSVKLFSIDHSYTTEVKVNFTGSSILIDPSFIDAQHLYGSLQIDWHPVWASGFVYTDLSTAGYTGFKQLEIQVDEILS